VRARELSHPERLYVLRLICGLEKNLDLLVYLVRQGVFDGSKVIEKLILHWNDKGIIGLPGARLTKFVDELVKRRVNVAVVTTSIMSSRTPGYNDVVLHPSLERVEYRVFRLKRVYSFNTINKPVRMRSLGLMKLLGISAVSLILGYLLKRRGSDVLVVSKTVLLRLLKSLPKERVRVYDDVGRGVIDWVEVVKDNGVDKVYLVYPHGRMAMGVEPPVTSVCSINFVHGVKRPATEYVVVRRVSSKLLRKMLRQVKSVKLILESIPGVYIVAEREKDLVRLRLYTKCFRLEMLIRPQPILFDVWVLVLSEVVIKVPEGVDAKEVKRRIEAILNLVISDEFDKFMEYLEEYALLRLQEESLREFLEDEPDVYAENDIKR